MRIVVTGASGSAGTSLLRRLGYARHEVVGIARRLPDTRRAPYDAADWVQCDIGSPGAGATLRRVFDGADAVVHLAWAIQPRADEPSMDRTNLRGSRAVLSAIRPSAVVQYDAGAEVARWALSPLLPAVILGRRLLPIPIWPALRAQVVHADDVAAALHLILDRHAGGEFNLAAEPVLTASTIARTFGGLMVPVPCSALAVAAWPT